MRRCIPFIRWLALLGLALPLAAQAWKPEIGDKPEPMEQIELIASNRPVDLNQYLGRPLILYFGADWCPPCVASGRPAVVAAFNQYKDRGLPVLFVSLDPRKARAGKREEAKALGFPIAMRAKPVDGEDKLRSFDFGAFGRIYVVPTAIILDADGKVVRKLEQGSGLKSELDSVVRGLLP